MDARHATRDRGSISGSIGVARCAGRRVAFGAGVGPSVARGITWCFAGGLTVGHIVASRWCLTRRVTRRVAGLITRDRRTSSGI